MEVYIAWITTEWANMRKSDRSHAKFARRAFRQPAYNSAHNALQVYAHKFTTATPLNLCYTANMAAINTISPSPRSWARCSVPGSYVSSFARTPRRLHADKTKNQSSRRKGGRKSDVHLLRLEKRGDIVCYSRSETSRARIARPQSYWWRVALQHQQQQQNVCGGESALDKSLPHWYSSSPIYWIRGSAQSTC